jgi:hypothetical protein
VESHRAFGDREAQSHSTSKPTSRVIEPVEGLEQLLQGIGRNTRAGIADAKHSFSTVAAFLTGQFDFD